MMDDHGNQIAVEGSTRCVCGVKYWENDRCIDCGRSPVRSITPEEVNVVVLALHAYATSIEAEEFPAWAEGIARRFAGEARGLADEIRFGTIRLT